MIAHRCWLVLFVLIAGCLLQALPSTAAAGPPQKFEIGDEAFLLNGAPLQIRCGEVHAARVPQQYWRHRLRMCKAMGLNTVCAYLFWNFHEPREGEFNWADRADVAKFCEIAQDEGLWVILRPGPYSCAEWEMGGLPWWLLKHDDIALRSRDPRFLAASKRYFAEVGRVLGPLQVTKGGPILMVQVENEYGFYGKDQEYLAVLRRQLIDAGFDVPLFQCNPIWHVKEGHRDDLFSVVNFGSDGAKAFAALREVQPRGPLMCGEFYPGWFDTWGAPHHRVKEEQFLSELEHMLAGGASFSIYMAHGGSSLGMWAGADRPFKPDTSSYDYDAPISEAGWVTPLFEKTREVIARHLPEGEKLIDPPPPAAIIELPRIEFQQRAAVFDHLPEPVTASDPKTYEACDLASGLMVYRRQLAAGPAAQLRVDAVHDFGWVSLDGKPIGVLDRRSGVKTISLPAREKPVTLDILVYAMGRVNFGVEVHDRKGLHGPVQLGSGSEWVTLRDWQMYPLPCDRALLKSLKYNETAAATGPAFYRAEVNVDEPGDTFLDLRSWGKGIVWINGQCLGRYWNIGPTQTMYLPGPWLKPGKNEIVVLDLLGPREAALSGLRTPILDELHSELDFAGARRPAVTLQLSDKQLVHTGEFAAEATKQDVKFDKPATGRYFCIETLSSQNGGPHAAIAELDLLGADGQPLSHEGWTIAYVSSEERVGEDGTAENAIDGQTANIWHTQWQGASPAHPHRLVIDLGSEATIAALRYIPRSGQANGRVKEYRVYVGGDLVKRN